MSRVLPGTAPHITAKARVDLTPAGDQQHIQRLNTSDLLAWQAFIQETYGCLTDDPIARGDQGTFETREVLE